MKGESGIIYSGRLSKSGESVKEGESIKVIVSTELIEFKISSRTIGQMKMPVGFLNDEILPYVALFNEGDLVEFVHGVAWESRENNK
jgi:hypothetical protein